MIVLPWYIRFGIDCAIIWTPFIYIHNHPTLFMEYFQNKRRIQRRRDFQQVDLKKDQFMTTEQTRKFYSELGIQL